LEGRLERSNGKTEIGRLVIGSTSIAIRYDAFDEKGGYKKFSEYYGKNIKMTGYVSNETGYQESFYGAGPPPYRISKILYLKEIKP